MIKYLFCILLISFSLFSSEKMYVQSHEIVIWGNSIYVHQKDDLWIKTNAINCDDNGIFLKPEDHIMWQVQNRCPRCGSFYDSFGECHNPSCR
jgi:hypothetical protein